MKSLKINKVKAGTVDISLFDEERKITFAYEDDVIEHFIDLLDYIRSGFSDYFVVPMQAKEGLLLITVTKFGVLISFIDKDKNVQTVFEDKKDFAMNLLAEVRDKEEALIMSPIPDDERDDCQGRINYYRQSLDRIESCFKNSRTYVV